MSVSFFQWAFYALIPITAVFAILGKPASARRAGYPTEFFLLRRRFLLAWYACVAVDWFHGPYLYDLYRETHGLSKRKIGILYVVGTGVPTLAGPLWGILADRFGRRRCCLAYCGLYFVTSALAHISCFSLLLIGRICNGIAIQILFSTFESWLVHAHHSLGLPTAALDNIFALMWFGNYLVAVLVGVLAQALADHTPALRLDVPNLPSIQLGGYTAPCDAALLCCLAGAFLVRLWGDDLAKGPLPSSATSKELSLFSNSSEVVVCLRSALTRPGVLLCGTILVGVESTMNIFVFYWTDALKEDERPFTQHGLVFASFMMCSMIGSSIYSLISHNPERLMLAAVVMLTFTWVSIFSARQLAPAWHTPLMFASFLLLEACFGTYFPVMSSLKSMIVPEASRSFVYTAYRAPMNLVVTIVLFLDLPFAPASLGSVALAAVAGCAALALMRVRFESADVGAVGLGQWRRGLGPGSHSTFLDSFDAQVELEPSFSSNSY